MACMATRARCPIGARPLTLIFLVLTRRKPLLSCVAQRFIWNSPTGQHLTRSSGDASYIAMFQIAPFRLRWHFRIKPGRQDKIDGADKRTSRKRERRYSPVRRSRFRLVKRLLSVASRLVSYSLATVGTFRVICRTSQRSHLRSAFFKSACNRPRRACSGPGRQIVAQQVHVESGGR